MTSIKLYRQYNDMNICFGRLDNESLSADYVIGVSLGAMAALKDIKNIKGKVILVNPPLPKKNFFTWIRRWLRYVKIEGLFLKRQKFTVNPVKFFVELVNCIRLMSLDFSPTFENVPKDKIIVVKGKDDTFFCDDEAVKFLRSKNVKVVEFEGGHNLSPKMEETMNNLAF